MLEKKISQKENLKKCITFEEQKGTRYIQGNIHFGIIPQLGTPLGSLNTSWPKYIFSSSVC